MIPIIIISRAMSCNKYTMVLAHMADRDLLDILWPPPEALIILTLLAVQTCIPFLFLLTHLLPTTAGK